MKSRHHPCGELFGEGDACGSRRTRPRAGGRGWRCSGFEFIRHLSKEEVIKMRSCDDLYDARQYLLGLTKDVALLD